MWHYMHRKSLCLLQILSLGNFLSCLLLLKLGMLQQANQTGRIILQSCGKPLHEQPNRHVVFHHCPKENTQGAGLELYWNPFSKIEVNCGIDQCLVVRPPAWMDSPELSTNGDGIKLKWMRQKPSTFLVTFTRLNFIGIIPLTSLSFRRRTVQNLASILHGFGEVTDLCTNFDKSSVVPIWCWQIKIHKALDGLAVERASFPIKYLGLTRLVWCLQNGD
jgi:hypothetical protein